MIEVVIRGLTDKEGIEDFSWFYNHAKKIVGKGLLTYEVGATIISKLYSFNGWLLEC